MSELKPPVAAYFYCGACFDQFFPPIAGDPVGYCANRNCSQYRIAFDVFTREPISVDLVDDPIIKVWNSAEVRLDKPNI